MALSIWVPISYITVLVCGMLGFSRWQRYKKKAIIAATEPWFSAHPERDLYITLLQASLQPPSPDQPPIDDRILMAALLCRAITDVSRIWSLRDTRPLLAALIQKGSLSEETNAKFAAAEKELEAEVTDVVNEANSFREGWGSYIFASASEMAHREKMMDIVRDIGNVRAEEARKLPTPNSSNILGPPSGLSPAPSLSPTLAPPTLPVPSTTPSASTSTSPAPTAQTPISINPSHLFNPATYPSHAPPLNGPAVLPQGVQLPPGQSLPKGMTQLQLMQFLSVQQARAMAMRAQGMAGAGAGAGTGGQMSPQQQAQQQQKSTGASISELTPPAISGKTNGTSPSSTSALAPGSVSAAGLMERRASGAGSENGSAAGGGGGSGISSGKSTPSKTTPSKKKGKRK